MSYKIDKIAKDTLFNYSATAPDDVWNGIKGQINNGKTKKIPLFYWKAIAASFALLISFGGGYFLHLDRSQNQHKLAKVKLEFYHRVNISSLKPVYFGSNEIKKIYPTSAQNNYRNQLSTHRYGIGLTKKATEKLNGKSLTKLAVLEKNELEDSFYKESNAIVGYSPDEMLAIQNQYFSKVEQEEKSEKIKKWGIGGHIAPSYSYREMKKNSTDLPSSYYNSVEKALLTYSGGLSVNLHVNKRISFESGINYEQFGQSSNLLYAQLNPEKGSAYEVATSAGVITPKPSSIHQISGEYRYVDPLGNIINTEAELVQNFTYFEVPLNTKIRIVDKKFGFSVIAGLNTDILLGNKVFFQDNGNKTYIGQTENLNQIRYSSNFRFGFDYKVNKKLRFKLEPGLKYSLVPINKNPEIDNYPYTFAVNTGIVLKF